MNCSLPGSFVHGDSPSKNTGVGCCALPGDLPTPGIKPRSPPLQADSLSAEPPGKPKNTGVGCHSLLQGIFPTQGSNLGLLHCRQILYFLSHQGSPLCCIDLVLGDCKSSSSRTAPSYTDCPTVGFNSPLCSPKCPSSRNKSPATLAGRSLGHLDLTLCPDLLRHHVHTWPGSSGSSSSLFLLPCPCENDSNEDA